MSRANVNMLVKSYKDLIVWQRSMELVEAIYDLTSHYPASEKYGLISQIRRSAVSIPSNIAEGKYRRTKKDYKKFLRIAFASGAELETQIELSKRLSILEQNKFITSDKLLEEVMKMLNIMLMRLSSNSSTSNTPNYIFE